MGTYRAIRLWLSVCIFVLQCGCKEEIPAHSSAPVQAVGSNRVSTAANGSPQRPQPRLQTLKLWMGTNELITEIASTPIQIETGMMWRTNMAEMEGMLFVFGQPSHRSFWMRNTLLPLSCAYIDPEGTILELHDMSPRDETPIPSASDRIQYVLEVNQGWFVRHNVRSGTLVTTEYGPLSKTFFRR
jgi:uncharacterized protein